MLDDWSRRRNADRSREGDGRRLPPIRWWQVLGRSLFLLAPDASVGRTSAYAVDVRHAGDPETAEVRAHLYVDGRLAVESTFPAAFDVPGGTIEVDRTDFGLKRCHLVGPDGRATMLTPDPRSPEGRRLRLARRRPGLSRAVGAVSAVVLLDGSAG